MGNTLEQQPIFINTIDPGGIDRQEFPNGQLNNGLSEPSKTKKTKTFRNPTSLKKSSLTLVNYCLNKERDAMDKNIFYIQFTYDSLVDFTLKVYFNACKCDYEDN